MRRLGEIIEVLNVRIGLRLDFVSGELGMVSELRGDLFRVEIFFWGDRWFGGGWNWIGVVC